MIFNILNSKVFVLCMIVLIIATLCYVYYPPKEKKEDVILFKFPHYIPRRNNVDEQVRNGVPLVIYETWHSHEIPYGMRDNIYNLIRMNPEFDYYLFSDEECAKFIEDNYDKDVLKAFHTLKPGAFKSDLWRYCVLYKMGGVYLDIKYYSTVPLINIIDEHSTVFVRDPEAPRTSQGCFYNGFMISPPKNEVFKMCIDDIVVSCKKKLYNKNMLDITGPCMLGRILQKQHTHKYFDIVQFEFSNVNGNFWNYYPGISYKDKIILKHYESYRSEQKKTENESHYSRLYIKGDVYFNI